MATVGQKVSSATDKVADTVHNATNDATTTATTTTTIPSTTAHRVHPVHSIKRLSASLTTRKSVLQSKISADFTDYRKRLQHAETTLRKGLDQYKDSRRSWDGVARNMEDFNQNLVGSPEEHKAEASMFKRAHDKAINFRRGVSTANDPSGNGIGRNKGLDLVETYLAQIEELKKEYPHVERLWSEMERYRKKNEKIEKRKKAKEEKKLRSVTKKDNSRKAYHVAVDDIVIRMRAAYEQYPNVLRALYSAYWKQQGDYFRCLDKETRVLHNEGTQHLSELKALPPLPPKTSPPPPIIKPVAAKPKTVRSTEEKPAIVAKTVITPVAKESEITPTQDPSTVVQSATPVATVTTTTETSISKPVEPSTVRKMEEKISDAGKTVTDNSKPIEVSKVSKDSSSGEKPTSKFGRSARLPSFKRILRRSKDNIPSSTRGPTATAA